MIPPEAVEAAMKAFDPSWDSVPAEWRDYFLRRARAALEAAAPYMQREAWNEGFAECKYDDVNPRPNPYRIPR